MKKHNLLIIFITIAFVYLISFYNTTFDFNIKDKTCKKNEFYFDPNSNLVESMDIKLKGNIISDSVAVVLYNFNRDYQKYQKDISITLFKGVVDTLISNLEWANCKGQIMYIPYSRNEDCNSELNIKIRLHKILF